MEVKTRETGIGMEKVPQPITHRLGNLSQELCLLESLVSHLVEKEKEMDITWEDLKNLSSSISELMAKMEPVKL